VAYLVQRFTAIKLRSRSKTALHSVYFILYSQSFLQLPFLDYITEVTIRRRGSTGKTSDGSTSDFKIRHNRNTMFTKYRNTVPVSFLDVNIGLYFHKTDRPVRV